MFDSRWDWLYILSGCLWILRGPGVQTSVIASIITLILQGLDRTLVSEILIRVFPKLWKFYLHLTKSVIYIATQRPHEEPVASCSFPCALACTVSGQRLGEDDASCCSVPLVGGEADILLPLSQCVLPNGFVYVLSPKGEKKSSWLE